MAKIKFGVGDILRSKIMDPGWRSFQILPPGEGVPNANKDGINYEIVFVLIDAGPDLNGKEIKRTFSSKAIGMFIPLVMASQGKKATDVEVKEFEFDLADLANKKIDGNVKIDIYNGQPNNKVEEYAPYKTLSVTGGDPFSR